MHIRFAQLEDLADIYAIYCPYIIETTITFETEAPTFVSFQDRFQTITAQYPWLIAEEDDEIIGYAYASRAFERAAYDWCADLAIYFRKDRAHHGGAAQLYQVLFELLKRQQVRVVYALITAENERSTSFHERMGFYQVGRLKGSGYKFGRWLDVIWMEKTLYDLRDPKPFQTIQQILTQEERMEEIHIGGKFNGSHGCIEK